MKMTEMPLLILEPERLKALARKQWRSYAAARPYPHVVFDDCLPADVLRRVVSEFPKPGQIDWIEYDGADDKKLVSKEERQMGPWTRLLFYQLNSSAFLSFLEELTGIEKLISDPYSWGGGLHQIERGGFLHAHADFNRHPRFGLDRRLNMLIYLNEDWREEYGGHFQLWDAQMTRCERHILPIFNRCVIFSTTSTSYHGHSDPLMCPQDVTRKSPALYYYTNGRPEEEAAGDHGTLFRLRPGERTVLGRRLRSVIRLFTPPVFFEIREGIRRRRRARQ